MRNRWAFAVMAVALAAPAAAEQKGMEQAVATIESWGQDAQVAKFVAAQNAKGASLDEIKKIDDAWQAGKAEVEPLVRTILTNACAQRLKALIGANEAFGETFVMDNQGALVCATDKTSDYWQGDEDKWQKSFAGGKGATFVDQARYDRSSKTTLAQVSVPVKQGGKVIGAITVGVRTGKLGQ